MKAIDQNIGDAIKKRALQTWDTLDWWAYADWLEDYGRTAEATRARRCKPNIPDVISKFVEYFDAPGNGAWGALHCVLDDHNHSNKDVRDCYNYAIGKRDAIGADLAWILFHMSRTQRGKLDNMVRRVVYGEFFRATS